MFFKIFIFWFVRFIYFFMINFSSKECNLVDHSLKHSSCQVINETKPHFSKHHHQIAKIIIHQIHQNLCRLLDYCRTSCFMKVRKFMPSWFNHCYCQMKKMSLVEPNLNPLKDFINFLNCQQTTFLQEVRISHLRLYYSIMIIVVAFTQLPMQIKQPNLFRALVKLLVKQQLLAKLIIMEAFLIH